MGKMKKAIVGKYSTLFMSLIFLSACGAQAEGEAFNAAQEINVITREDGSGTRGAFTELTGILVEEGESEIDKTSSAAAIQNGTNGVMTTVSGDPAAIGYISVGSLNDSVKEVKIDGNSPTTEAIAEGSYAIARPFNVAHKDTLKEEAADFWSFIFSAEGQEIVSGEGYIESIKDAP